MSNTLLQGIYENAPIGMAVVDAENDYIQCNPTYFQIFGYSETDLLKRPFSSFCEAGYSVEFSKLLEELRSGKRKSFEMDCRITRKDSELVWVHYVISPLSQEGDGGARLIVLVSDITEQRSMEKDLKKSEQSLVDFFESSPIGLLWADSDGRIVRVNPELQEMLKRPAEQLCGRCIQEFDVEEELTEILASLKEGKTIHDHRAHLNLSDGGAVHVLIDAVPLMDAGTVLRTDWYLRDITSRVELERKLLDATERERQNVGIELHDNLGQILHGAYYLSTELKDRLKKREVPEAAELKRIIDSLSHATELVRDLSHGLQPVSPMPDGLVVALRELAEHVRKTYGLKARFVCPEPVVVSNAKVATHLYRIAQEAVSNAVKHSKCERISLWLKSAEGRVILGVRDDGRGLGPTANHQKGIGLKVMHYRAHAINGSIAMQHIARGGTEVVCTIKDSPETKSPW
jgi:PAS domain S-box-containing protein